MMGAPLFAASTSASVAAFNAAQVSLQQLRFKAIPGRYSGDLSADLSAAPNRSISKDDAQCCVRQTKTQRDARSDCFSEPVRPVKPIRYDVKAMASPDSWHAHRAQLPDRRPAADSPALQRRTHTRRRSPHTARRPLGPRDLKSHSTARPSPGSI